MSKNEIIIIVEDTEDNSLTLSELCRVCGISSDFIIGLVKYEIIHPRGHKQEEWLFNIAELQRVRTVLRLQRDLEVNLAGAAVVLDLLDRLNELDEQMRLMEKHYRIK